jgi:nicotinate-nucleotide pyrophosphorylase (carboxylating)
VQQRVRATGVSLSRVERIIREALTEVLDGGADVTSVATVSDRHRSTMDIVARAGGTICGLAFAEAVFAMCDPKVTAVHHAHDGDRVTAGTVLLSITGPTRSLLLAERTALNLLGHLSGIATTTSKWVDALAGTNAKVRDTRKTLPNLRVLQKYAVRCGGGENHRMSLSDAALIKDNHVEAAGSVGAAFDLVRRRYPDLPLEVEVDTLEQLREVLEHDAQFVLLDNFSVDQLREAVHITNGRCRLEASGGLTLATAREVAETGVDYLAVGALTHSVTALDVAADLRAADEEESN